MCPKQLDYFHEVQEFEAEMQKHSHRYPHDILSYYSVHVCGGHILASFPGLQYLIMQIWSGEEISSLVETSGRQKMDTQEGRKCLSKDLGAFS